MRELMISELDFVSGGDGPTPPPCPAGTTQTGMTTSSNGTVNRTCTDNAVLDQQSRDTTTMIGLAVATILVGIAAVLAASP